MQTSYDQFWQRYLRAHAHPGTRALHYAGTSMALGALALAAARRDWRWMVAAPLVGYGVAWTAHAAIEGNRPETFGHPVWALLSDLRMLALAAAGRLGPHLERAGLPR
ncbi:MAG TPA: DUF962 domain-containing protein [Acetobacteraceae bacterium]|nr:DUF962 domain-containing protein [Acetobacteraceae bacterium]